MRKGAIDSEKFRLIEDHILDRMSGADRADFDAQLENDADLREETHAMRENILAIELGGFSRSIKEVVASERNVRSIDRDRNDRSMRYLAYAASIAILIALAIWSLTRPPLHERLYSEYYHPDPGLPVAMSATDDHLFHDAMVAYKLGDLKEAREKWTSLLGDLPENDTLLYYIASTHLNEGRPEAAIPLYEQVVRDTSSVFAVKARWYLFLSYVYLNDREKAMLIAPSDDGSYGERVKQLTDRLDP